MIDRMTVPPVLVVGGAGTVGRRVVSELLSRGASVRLLVRDMDRVRHLPPTVERIVGDLGNPRDVANALKGVRAAFYLSPHDPNEVALARSFVRQCEAANARLVYAGVHIPDPRWLTRTTKRLLFSVMLPAYRGKLRVGELIITSATSAVVLVGTHFMQNDELFVDDIADGQFPIPLAAGGVNRVDVRDLAELAARALIEADFLSPGAYPVVGPRSVSGPECADLWSQALGQPVRYVGDDDSIWIELCRRRVGGQKLADFMATGRLQQKRSFPTDPDQLSITSDLLGRPPRDYPTYVREAVRAQVLLRRTT